MYHMVHEICCTIWYMATQAEKSRGDREELLDRCLRAFIKAGTLDLSLDRLACRVGISKRMLIHYFGGRENIEHGAMALLEDRLRAQFRPDAFPAGVSPEIVVMALWERTTSPDSKGVLLLVMDLCRRAWRRSARAFYDEQQRLWFELLLKFIPDRSIVEEVLQLFQGAVLAYLITGDPEPGRRALLLLVSRQSSVSRRSRLVSQHSKDRMPS
jgi:AcrR family transcriptional regulator